MRKLSKTKALKSDHLEDFKNRLLLPIMRYKPKFVDLDIFLRQMFNTTSRIISTYWAKCKTQVPGVYLRSDMHPCSAYYEKHGSRDLDRYDRIICRIDDQNPEIVDVDCRGAVFRLTKYQWQAFRKDLTLEKDNQEL